MTKLIKFKSFSSGSCGNCYFLGLFDVDNNCEYSILIDAGVSPRRIKKELAAEGLDTDRLNALLITHDHMDHIRSLGSICKHFRLPVWSTPDLIKALSRHYFVGNELYDLRQRLKPEWNEIVEGRVFVKYFLVPHDASQTVGYAIMIEGHKFVIMTDIGAMTKEALELAKQADTVVIESNYDREMLLHGPYPKELQDRIMSGNGHLSNTLCASAVSEFYHEGLRQVFLCHLSEHNNTPRLAFDTTRKVLPPEVRLVALPRQISSNLFTL